MILCKIFHCVVKKSIVILPVFLLLVIISMGLSCSDTPTLEDIEQLNDRNSPVFYIEYPWDGDMYEDIIRVKGEVIDEPGAVSQAERIDAVSYSINEGGPETVIPINDSGSFLVSFSTFHLSGNISLLFKATDVSGNTGIKKLLLKDTAPTTPEPEASPTPIPTLFTPDYSPGTFWFVPHELYVSPGNSFTTEIHFNSGSQSLAVYGMTVYYNFTNINIDPTVVYNGVVAGPDGFISAANMNTSGSIVMSGFDVLGVGPGSSLHVLTIHWTAVAPGNTFLSIAVSQCCDPSAQTIGTPQGIDCTVIVE